MTVRRTPRAALALLLVPSLLVVGCGSSGGGGGGSGDAGTVTVTDNKFTPATIQVAVGDTVTWSFEGSALHNINGPGFKSKNLKKGTFEHTFNSAGTVSYICTLHPGMKGKVEVS